MFYSFGILGFIWVIFWVIMYKEVRGPTEEEFIQPPKVGVTSVCVLGVLFEEQKTTTF